MSDSPEEIAPELTLTDDLITSLSYVIQLEKHQRFKALCQAFSGLNKDELLKVLDGVINVGCDYATSCDEAVFLHMVTTGEMHPYSVEKLNMPSFQAAIKGLYLAKRAPNQSVLCESCAYRCGTLANHSETTQADLEYAKANETIFYCHQDIENLNHPTREDRKRMRPCRGWAQDVKRTG